MANWDERDEVKRSAKDIIIILFIWGILMVGAMFFTPQGWWY